MKLLGVDTTGLSMSVAVVEDDVLLGEVFVNNGKKHSQTFMPAVDQLLALVNCSMDDMDAFAVTVGPGSFTGIRIGTAAVSAMAYAVNKPIYAVNTLDALLENVKGNANTCAIMDARRGEVYTAARHGADCIIKESAIPLTQLLHELMNYDNVMFVGDGVTKHKEQIMELKPDSLLANGHFLLQRASSACMCVASGKAIKTSHDKLRPHYLRLSQAERMKGK